jgi:hypothetical protein
MTDEQFRNLTPAQAQAFYELVENSSLDFDELVSRAYAPSYMYPYVGIPNFHGMFVGIETDGYVHT